MSLSGTTSAPAALSTHVIGLSGILVNVTIPLYGGICVDEYKVTLGGSQNPVTLHQTVTNASQNTYSFYFSADLCRQNLAGLNFTAVAITNGMEGDELISEAMDILERSSKSVLLHFDEMIISFIQRYNKVNNHGNTVFCYKWD